MAQRQHDKFFFFENDTWKQAKSEEAGTLYRTSSIGRLLMYAQHVQATGAELFVERNR